MTSKITAFSLCAITALALGAPQTFAATTTTGNLLVTATVLDTCIVTTGTALAFATISTSAATNETTPGTITIVCTATRSGLTVTLGAGGNAASSQRRMADGLGHYLPYNVHSDSGHASAVAVDGEIYNGGVTSAVPVLIPVYGQVPAGAYSAGVYSDTVLVTLEY